jgi:hypothetical protein
MKSKVLKIVFMLLVFSQPIFSQSASKTWFEIGLACPMFPSYHKSASSSEYVIPVLSPSIGIIRDGSSKDHFKFTYGIQYQFIGNRSYEKDNFLSWLQVEHWKKQTFHKLCLPITIGYAFTSKKNRLSVYCGLRPNLFLYGKFSEKYLNTYNSGSTNGSEDEWNPFDKDQVHQTAKRITSQFLIGFSTTLGSKLKLAINCSVGGNNKYVRYGTPPGNEEIIDSINNSDLGITLSYGLNQKNKATDR